MELIFNNPLLLFGLAVVVICAAGIFAWHFWGENIQKRLRGAEKLPAMFWKLHPKVDTDKLEIEGSMFLVDPKSRRAWFYDSHSILYKPGGEMAGILLTDDSCIPQYPGMKDKLAKACESIKKNGPYMWYSRCMADIERVQREGAGNTVAEWLGIGALASVVGVEAMGLILLLPRIKDAF